MSVSLRVTGAWAELTADGSVAIPATPQAGDRMYLYARWKDFSVTATVANWTELVEFADGAVGAGNGSGSVKVGCWYRDWQSGDTDPAIDFSASPDNASVVIMVMQKGADDVWDTPVAVTAAMTNWTTTSQIVAASSTADVKSSGVVMGLIGIRDDSATMTRPTTGIDDSAAAITWNGNYVESPATHHSTTTGFDGAADLGYRLVTIGATATLRMTGTISAAETGTALWVVQGVSTVVIPSTISLTLSTFAPKLSLATTPSTASLVTASFAPKLAVQLIPATTNLSLTAFAPVLNRVSVPGIASLTLGSFAPKLHEQITPPTVNLTLTSFAPAPSILMTLIPGSVGLTISTFGVVLNQPVEVPSLSLTLTRFIPSILPPKIIFLDPGGDAVQAVGHFNTDINTTGLITYDNTQQFIGVGSYKCDSGDGTLEPIAEVAGVLGPAGRISCRFRYDSVPDAIETVTEFAAAGFIVYSGGGFGDVSNFSVDDSAYATATPAKNAGQGHVFGSFNLDVPVGAVIDSVKIIYERKYDVNTSIGISRVKWRIDGEEGPDHDNTDQPLTDTVVEVDVTGDRGWTWQDLRDGVDPPFEVIAEARRGDTDTAHTQSWDYVKVEVVYHLANVIFQATDSGDQVGFSIAITPHGDGAVLRFADGAGDSFDGINKLPINTWPRISFGYVLHGVDDLDINIYLNGLLELSIEGASTGGFIGLINLLYGWIYSPGVDHLCWFDQLHIDDGDDLSDPGNKLSTAKRSAAVNENNWNTTIGNGAVNERPLSITNGKQHTSVTGVRQTYTLEAVDEGDIDLTGETLVGYMIWAWAKLGAGDTDTALALIGNNVVLPVVSLGTTAALLKLPATTSVYPSHAAGVGMRSNDESADTFLYECGAIQAYEGPAEEAILAYQLLAENTILDLVDDLRADPPESYEFCYRSSESETAAALITVSSLDQEGGSTQWQVGTPDNPFPINGGSGQIRITAGIEVQVHVEVTGGPLSLGLWHRVNFD